MLLRERGKEGSVWRKKEELLPRRREDGIHKKGRGKGNLINYSRNKPNVLYLRQGTVNLSFLKPKKEGGGGGELEESFSDWPEEKIWVSYLSV